MKGKISMQATTTAANLALDVVDEFVRARRLFTAFDVTKEIRNRTQENIRHNSINELVDALYMNETAPLDDLGDYIRESHSFLDSKGTLVCAQVYRPVGVDVSTYQPNDIKQTGVAYVPSVAKTAFPISVQAPAQIVPLKMPVLKPLNIKASPSTTPVRIDQRGRLCVPNKLTKSLGLKTGDSAYVYSTGAPIGMAIACVNILPVGYELLACYTVDKSNNVRVSPWVVSACGLSGIPSSARLNGLEILIE